MRVDLNAQTMNGETPLLAAAKHGQLRVAIFLLSQKADVEMSGDQRRWTALHEAAKLGREDMCSILLGHWGHERSEKGIRRTITMSTPRNAHGSRPSQCSSRTASKEIVDKKSLANLRCKSGSTPLLEAVDGDNVEIVQQMIHDGGDVNLRMPDGTTALMKAAANGDVEMCRALVDGGSYLCRQRCCGKCREPRVHRAVVDSISRSAAGIAIELTRQGRRYGEVAKFLNSCGAK